MHRKTHKFGDMTYHSHGHYPTKSEAESVAKSQRGMGKLARIVHHKKGYCVFTHSKE